MRFGKHSLRLVSAASMLAMGMAGVAHAEEADEADASDDQAIVVIGSAVTYNNASTTEGMLLQQTPLTSPLSAIDALPGVSVQEGDTFGFDDWSTTVAVRGFQTNLDEQQVGITIDGLPNGGSNYGGGAKANRYIDTMNIGTVEVSQGTSDIASLSNEGLGGTLNFTTSDPTMDRRIRFSTSLGENDALRAYARFDTGDLGGVSAWVSATHQEATDWMNGAAENWRDHFAAKFVTDGPVRITGYASYDDTHEDNYQRLFSPDQFIANPGWDELTAEWTGIPYVDQVYRKGWSTLRKNTFAYLKADGEVAEGLEVSGGAYYHHNWGRGDWIPPYIVDVTDDGAGNGHSELVSGNTVEGGSALGQIFYVDSNGVALAPYEDCVSSITFPYGGAGAQYDPACYPAGAIPVQSYRHTNYKKDRYGFTADFAWSMDIGGGDNRLRGGIWYEGGKRKETRSWQKLTDARVGYEFDHTPYWIQYNREYPQSTFKWYVEDQLTFGPFKANFGIKQFINNLERNDVYGETSDVKLDSTSKVLFSGGAQFEVVPGMEVFAGYAENFKALGDEILERPDADLGNLEPETAENIEAGARYSDGTFMASATYFSSKFDNRIIFLSNETAAGPNYLIGTNGSYFNAGGIDSEGFELLMSVRPLPGLSLYGSYTHVNAEYNGTGDAAVDAAVGIVPGNKVTGVPQDMFVLSADWNNGPFRIGVSGKYTGDRFVDVANSWVADANFVADAYIGVRGEAISDAFQALDLSLNINNLFDESYLGGISGGGAWIGAPRTVVFTLTADF